MANMASALKLTEFWQWWISELMDMLPNDNVISLNREGDMQIYIDRKSCRLDYSSQNIAIKLNEKFSSQRMSDQYNTAVKNSKNNSTKSCDIYIDKNLLLTRSITLPLATEENIKDVIAYEIDRYTPFKKEDIYFDVNIIDKNKSENKLTVLITVVKKAILDEVLSFCNESGVVLNKTFSKDNNTTELFFTGLPAEATEKAKKTNNGFLVICILVLLVIALCIPVAKNYWLASKYQNKIEQISPQIAEIKELRSEFQVIRKRADLANKLSANNFRLIELLEELTRLIPNDTSLARFSLQDNSVRIQGSSLSASKLIAILDASTIFNNVEFAAPVTKNNDTGKENFTIEIELNTEDHVNVE